MTSELKTRISVQRIGDDPKPYTFSITAREDGQDVCVLAVLVEWTHGIFGTHEQVRVTAVHTAVGDDFVVQQDGRIERHSETDDFHAALGRAFADLL